MTYMDIFRDLRQERGLSQSQIAQLLKTSQQYYGKYENGQRQLPISVLIKLAKYYNVSTDYILEISDDPTINK